MHSSAIVDPPNVKRQMESLITEQAKLNKKRSELLEHLR